MSRSSSDLPSTPKVIFPPDKQLKLSSGAGGHDIWKNDLKKFASGAYPTTCKSFTDSVPIIQPPKPSPHDLVTQTRFVLPLQDSTIKPPSTPSNPTSRKIEFVDDSFSSSRESPGGGYIQNASNSSPTVHPQTSAEPSTRQVPKYQHDEDGWLTDAGQAAFNVDEARWQQKFDELHIEKINFFTFLISQALHSTVISSLEADSRWSNIQEDFNLFELSIVLQELVTCSKAIRSIDSLAKLVAATQGSKTDAEFTLYLSRVMKDVIADFGSDLYPGTLDCNKLKTGLLLLGTNHREYAINHLATQPEFSLTNFEKINSDLAIHAKNSETAKSYAKAAGKSPSHPKDNLNPTQLKQEINKLHSLLNQAQGSASSNSANSSSKSTMPKRDPSLLTLEWPHTLPEGDGTLPTKKPGNCKHCLKANWNFTNHSDDTCADLSEWTKRFGKSTGIPPTPSKPKSPPTSNFALQQQSDAARSLLNTIIDVPSRNNMFEVLNRTDSSIDSSSQQG